MRSSDLTPAEVLPRYRDGADWVVWEEGAAEGRFCIADLHHAHTACTCVLTMGTGVLGGVFISLVLLIRRYLWHWCLTSAWEDHNTFLQVCDTASLTHCYTVSNQHGDINQSSLLSGPWGCLIHVSLVEIAFALLLSLPWETLWPNEKTLL